MTISLAIDCDGVLVANHLYWKGIAKKEGITQPFLNKYNDIYKVRCSDGEIFANKLFGEYRDEWLLESDPFPEVAGFIEKINRSNDIKYWIVTARNEDVRYQTEKWLNKHEITEYEQILHLKDKTKAPCNTIVDDKLEHVLEYQKKSRMAFLIDATHNRHKQVFIRVKNLTEVYQQLLPYI